MKYMVKVHEIERYGIKEVLVALCDPELIGKRLREGEVEFYVNPRFYGGELIEEEKVKEHLGNATIANIIGKKSVELAMRLGFIDGENVMMIKGIPHAQMVLMFE